MSQLIPFSTRIAVGTDARAVRMLLSSPTDVFVSVLVAESGDPPRIVAAGALTRSQRPKPLAGPGIAVEVIAPFRRQGIARSLLAQLASHAREMGAKALYATRKVDLDGDEMKAWATLGFTVCETVEHHELPLDEFEPQLAPLYDRMRDRGKIPTSARIIPLHDADLSQVLELHLSLLGGDSVSLGQRLRGEAPESFAPRHSRVLMIDDRVVGFILGHRVAADTVHVDANVVAPGVRGSWANVWLKLEATRGAIQWGIKKFVFTTFDHYKDTRSFTDRMRGTTVRKSVLMYLPLEPVPSSAGLE